MMVDFEKYVAERIGVTQQSARAAIGILLNAAERQGSPMAEFVFQRIPGARTLAARSGDAVDAPTGVIARLVEQTPGGRSAVAFKLADDLLRVGLGPHQSGNLIPVVSDFLRARLGFDAIGHLGDLLGQGEALDHAKFG